MCNPSRIVRCCVAILLPLLIASCALHQHGSFQVLRGVPSYLLRSPDSRKTPLPDVLRNFNGFEPAHRFIDLLPLMELRIENAYYQQGSSRKGLQGFSGTEIAHYTIEPNRLQLVSVQLMSNRPLADLPVQKLIAASAQHSRYYRLYYEIVFNSSNDTHGSVLLNAESQQELEQLSAQLQNPDTSCVNHANHCTVFPEACSVSVEMKVVVNGKPEDLVWGSLLSNLTGDQPKRLEVQRLYRGHLRPVRIDRLDPASLRVPLLPGDRIHWE